MDDNVQKSILVFMQVYCINVHKSMQAQCNNVRKVLQIYRTAIIAGTAIFVIPQQHSNVCNSTAVQQCLKGPAGTTTQQCLYFHSSAAMFVFSQQCSNVCKVQQVQLHSNVGISSTLAVAYDARNCAQLVTM